jgi:hypothetical protein
MTSLAYAETQLGSEFDAAALQWYLRLWKESVTPEIFDQLMVAQVWNMDVRDLQHADLGRPLPQ